MSPTCNLFLTPCSTAAQATGNMLALFVSTLGYADTRLMVSAERAMERDHSQAGHQLCSISFYHIRSSDLTLQSAKDRAFEKIMTDSQAGRQLYSIAFYSKQKACKDSEAGAKPYSISAVATLNIIWEDVASWTTNALLFVCLYVIVVIIILWIVHCMQSSKNQLCNSK